MKMFVFAFVILLASVAAIPQGNERFVDGIVASAIEDLSEQLKENGYDPYELTDHIDHQLPVTDLMKLRAEVENLLVLGLSNIVINRMNYSILTSRLTFDISLPRIAATVDTTGIYALAFGYRADGTLIGSVDILNARVTGDLRLYIGIVTGISVRSLTLDFTLGGIQSNLRFRALGVDYSNDLNYFLSATVPKIIEDNRADINTVLEYYLIQLIEEELAQLGIQAV